MSGPPTHHPSLPGGLRATSWTALAGGDIGQVWRVHLGDGRDAVVKYGPVPATFEVEGLAALRDAGARVPDVLAWEDRALVLAHVSGPGDPAALGRSLAQLHTRTAPRFGWHRDNVLGPLPQPNPWMDDWPSFLATARLLPQLDAIPAGTLPDPVASRLRDAVESGRLHDELEHAPVASLVHGDLWSGNIVGGRWLIDPAVHHADRETDLAMLALFGGVPPSLLAGYEEVAPLPTGWQRRQLVLQLVPLLVHVRLFGSGYVPGILHRLDDLGW